MITDRLNSRAPRAAAYLLAAGTAIAGVITGLGVLSSASEASHRTDSPAPSGTPNYVSAAALPQGARYGSWNAGPVADGVPAPAPFCLDGIFDAGRTGYRSYSANLKVAADEFLSVQASAQDATALMARLRTQLQGCYRSWLAQDIPAYRNAHRSASWARYAGDDSPAVYGVFTVPPAGFDHSTHLYAVGAAGTTVMVLHLVLAGDQADAPVNDFRASAKAALAAIY